MCIGVTEGYKKQLEVIGVGYRANATGQVLELSLGYSHPFIIEFPKEITVSAVSDKGKALTQEFYAAHAKYINDKLDLLGADRAKYMETLETFLEMTKKMQ